MMVKQAVEITPAEIRAIREKLRLTQVEAGELLGGGPRAFTKYEAGTIKPAASVVRLLRVLDENPAAREKLTGRKSTPLAAEGLGPFAVSGGHIAALSQSKLVALIRHLLSAEAQAAQLPRDGIHVAANTTAPDGGEDARIEWKGGPERTAYLPARLNQFQSKAANITATKAAKEVSTKNGDIKPMVRSALEAGGTYIMISSHSCVEQERQKRAGAIHASLKAAGLEVDPSRIQFRDGDQIAEWVNSHLGVALWVLEQTHSGYFGPFRGWTHWAGRSEHEESPWVDDARLPKFRDKLRAIIAHPRGVARVIGLSGIGKSRLTLEALGPTPEEEAAFAPSLNDLVLYAVESDAGATTIKDVVQSLVDGGKRLIVVVDRCGEDTHQDLAAMVKRSSSRVSLVTIDHEIPAGTLPPDTLLLDRADESVIEKIIDRAASDLSPEDKRRLTAFSSRFPQMARLAADAWLQGDPLSVVNSDALINRIVVGRDVQDVDLTIDAAMLLSVFGLLGIDAPYESEIDDVTRVGSPRGAAEVRAALVRLADRRVAQRRGRLLTLQPRPVALNLAERQWKRWDSATWDAILTGTLAPHVRARVARQLSLLNRRPIATEIAQHVCRRGGPLDSLEQISEPGNTDIVRALAEIDAEATISLLERVLHQKSVDELQQIEGDVRRNIVWALNHAAFPKETFERGALLLLDLAVAENEEWSNNATGDFKSLFPVLLADTEAGPDLRIRLLDEILRTAQGRRLEIAVDALLEGAKMDSFSRTVGPEIHGMREALKPWTPLTWGDAWAYVRQCGDRLAALARRDDKIGEQVRNSFGHSFRSYARDMLPDAERWIAEVTAAQPYWPQALAALADYIRYDHAASDTDQEVRVRALMETLTPQDNESRVRFLVTEMPWDYPDDEDLDYDEKEKRQTEVVEQLARQLLGDPDELRSFLPQLSYGDQRKAVDFGRAIAENAPDAREWLESIVSAVEAVPANERNFSLLGGFGLGLRARHPDDFEQLKCRAAASAELGPSLPWLCLVAGIMPSDISLVIEGLRQETVPPQAVRQWSLGGRLAQLEPPVVAPLFDQLLSMEGVAYPTVIQVMGMYVHGAHGRLNDFRPQLKSLAEALGKQRREGSWQMDCHHFETLMLWLLNHGYEDADARYVARTLAEVFATATNSQVDKYISPLLPRLLSEFSAVVWPILGNVITRDRRTVRRLESALRDRFRSKRDQNPPITCLPPDILFAWCAAHPEQAPYFVARAAPMWDSNSPPESRAFHPLVLRLLDEFGDREDVRDGLVQNMHTFGWTGSLTSYYAQYDRPLEALKDHRLGDVRRWAQKMRAQFKGEVERARVQDEEEAATWE